MSNTPIIYEDRMYRLTNINNNKFIFILTTQKTSTTIKIYNWRLEVKTEYVLKIGTEFERKKILLEGLEKDDEFLDGYVLVKDDKYIIGEVLESSTELAKWFEGCEEKEQKEWDEKKAELIKEYDLNI